MALDVTPHEAVVGDVELEGRGTGGVDGGRSVLLHETEDAEDAAHPGFPLAAMNSRAQRADVRAGPRGLGQQRQRARRRAGRPIVGMDDMTPARGLAAVFPQELAGARIEQADVTGVPLHGDFSTEPAGWSTVVAAVDLDAVIEMHGAAPELVVAEWRQRQRPQGRPLLGKHRGDLALGGAVDAGVGPARVPAIEIG